MTKYKNGPIPRLSLRLLAKFCPAHLLEEIEGDLIQRYERNVIQYGERKAKRKLFWNVAAYFRPGILLRNNLGINRNPMMLFQNNLTMTFRNMRKDKVFSSINFFGLTTSMAASLLIFQYAFFELNYDRYEESENVYRVYSSSYNENQLLSSTALTPSVFVRNIEGKLPEITNFARLYSTRYWFDCTLAFRSGGDLKVFNEKNLYYTDPAALSIFDYRLMQGDNHSALVEPFSIVLSERIAEKYFGNEPAVGKTIRVKGSSEDHDYRVTGIMTNPRADSHIDADIFASLSTLEKNRGFEFSDSYTYVKLQSNIDANAFQNKLDKITASLYPPDNGRSMKFIAEPIADAHLFSTLIDEMKPTGNVNVIYLLVAVALIVLTLAWINCVNLTTARSFARAKEVGIRKISGATRLQVTFKFLTEVVVFNVIGLLGAFGLVYLISPMFYGFVNVPVPQDYFLQVNFGVSAYLLVTVFIAGILISGLLPALSLSTFQPVRVLKGKWIERSSRWSVRKATVVFQFASAIGFVIMVFTFNRQFDFMKHQDIGIDVSKTLVLRAPANVDSSYKNQLRGFKNELNQRTIASNVATSSVVPGNTVSWTAELSRNPNGPPGDNFLVNVIDTDFIKTYDLQVLAGRNFEEIDFPLRRFGDKVETLILNRASLNYLGFTNGEEAIGSTLYWGNVECRVIGVVENYYQQSLKRAIQPQVFIANNGPLLSLKLTTSPDLNFPETLTEIRTIWNKYFPDNAFDYFFLQKAFDEQYAADQQLAGVFNFFSALAMLISCLGLFGLSLFSVQLRTKEVSIRKVMGAPIVHLIQLLTREYLLLILIAAVIAIPISYWGISIWLSGFALHVEQTVWLYVAPVIFVLLVGILTVGVQTLKVVQANPTENLKHE